MAKYVGDESTIGTVPSFGIPQAFVSGPGPQALSPAVMGSQAGVPGVDSLAGTQSNSQSARQYGLDKAGAPPSHQPLFWLFVLFIVGVLMIAHFAHYNIR